MILLYNFIWVACLPIIILLMIFRIITGKEDILRLGERFGIASAPRSNKKIIWIHAASIGESRIALTLTKDLELLYPGHKILISTGTLNSARMIRKSLNANIVHQFIPIDNYLSIWLFLRYWRPEIGILIEAELWPNLLHIGSQFCPLLLINARMSDRSFEKWTKYRFIVKTLFTYFKLILCQSKIDHKKYVILGAKDALYIGNLKYSGSKLDVSQHNLKSLQPQLKNRLVWLAASTHPGDEEMLSDVHVELKKQYANLLTIIAPRHISRASDIRDIMSANGLSSALRSEKNPITSDTDVYIADTIGELGLFFSVAQASFIGGSFKNGGHSPIEPAYFDTVILFGQDMSNFAEIANEFLKNAAAFQVTSAKDLSNTLDKIFSGNLKAPTKEAASILRNHANVMATYLSYIKKELK